MKTFVKAKHNSEGRVESGKIYEISNIYDTEHCGSGKCVVILDDKYDLSAFDADFFQ